MQLIRFYQQDAARLAGTHLPPGRVAARSTDGPGKTLMGRLETWACSWSLETYPSILGEPQGKRGGGACWYNEPKAKEAQHPTLPKSKTWAKPGLSTGSQLALSLDSKNRPHHGPENFVKAETVNSLGFVGQEAKLSILYRYLHKYLKFNHLKI